MSDDIRIIVADDHPIVRRGLVQVIATEPGLQVVSEAGDGSEALRLIREMKPAVVVLDIDMPGMGGFAVARELQKERLAVAVIFLTIHSEEDMFNEALDVGALGYVLKESAVSDIAAAIKSAATGQHYISPSISGFLVNRGRRGAALEKENPTLNDLTPSERRILKLIAEDKSSKEIGELLFISHRTVENHRTNICQKLGLSGSHALVRFALKHKSELT
jgi:DNA-binding NarL/FixJ family response regulator